MFVKFRCSHHHTYVKASLFVIVMLLAMLEGNAQIVQGCVLDENNTPMQGVLIIHCGEQQVSDALGCFEVDIKNPDSTIQFKFIGYRDFRYMPRTEYDSTGVTIKMTPLTNDLETFELSSDRTYLFHHDLKDVILDYAFLNGFIIILKHRDKQYYLDLLTTSDSLVNQFELHVSPKRLFTDCFNKLHLISKQGVFQVNCFDGVIELIAYPYVGFEQLIMPCVCDLPEHILFKQYSGDNQTLSYISMRKVDGNFDLFTSVADEEGSQRATKYKEVIRNTHVKDRMAEISIAELMAIRDHQEDIILHDVLLIIPIYCPIFNLDDTVYLFDHISDSLLVMDTKGSVLRTQQISYHKSRNWEKLLLQDRVKGHIYAIEERNGFLCCRRIDLKNGLPGERVCTGLARTKKPLIYNNSLYFLATRERGAGMTQLYRCQLRN